jgi:hypothetical protein
MSHSPKNVEVSEKYNIKYEKKQKTFKVLFLIRVIKHFWVWLMIYCSILKEHHLPLKIVMSKLTKEKERGSEDKQQLRFSIAKI